MSQLPELTFDADISCHVCVHELGDAEIDVYLDVSEETVDVDELRDIAQAISDGWETRHPRLAKLVAEELIANDYVTDDAEPGIDDCVPFYLRLYANPDGEISYTVAFNVPSVLDENEDYIDVEEEVHGEWVNVEISSVE